MTAYDALLLRLYGDVRAIAGELARTYDARPYLDRDDLRQIGFLAAVEAIHDPRHQDERGGYLLRRARWRIADAIKIARARKLRWRLIEARRLVPSADELELLWIDPAPLIDMRVDVARLLRQLPDDERLAIWLVFFADLEYRPAARIMGIAASGVHRRVQRGLERMRALMKEAAA